MFGKNKVNRKSFAQAAAQLSHDDYNEVVVYDSERNEFSVSNRTYAKQLGENIVMHGDTGYETDGMNEQDWIDFFMSDAFDFDDISQNIEK